MVKHFHTPVLTSPKQFVLSILQHLYRKRRTLERVKVKPPISCLEQLHSYTTKGPVL